MSRPHKHKFHELAVGESYEVPNAPRWIKSAVYSYGAQAGKYFSACKLANGALEIRRLAGPQTAADISRAKSAGAKVMHARLKAKRSNV
jgi:hypothetical protein